MDARASEAGRARRSRSAWRAMPRPSPARGRPATQPPGPRRAGPAPRRGAPRCSVRAARGPFYPTASSARWRRPGPPRRGPRGSAAARSRGRRAPDRRSPSPRPPAPCPENLEPAPLQGREEVGALQRHRRESAGNLSMKRYRIEARWSLAVATTKEETRPVRSTIAFGLTLMLALALAACSSGGASPPPRARTAPPAPPAPVAAVTIVDFASQPADLTVKVGDTVAWTNTGNAPHTVKWDDGTPASDRLTEGGAPYERTFDAPGTF